MQMKSLLATLVVALCASSAYCQGLAGGAPTDLSDCETAIIGGGPGGVYTAFRLLESNASASVCLFEATGRLGGRIYSVHNLGPRKDLTLDMGAYRYMPLTQPIITELIQNFLKLPNRLYQPGIPDYKVILTQDGSNAGFNTFVVALAKIAQTMGLELNYNSRIVRMYTMDDGTFTLQTSAGRNITADNVILNLPSRPLHRLLQASGLPKSGPANQALLETYQIRATKLYLFYPQAWWLANGLNNGSLAYNLPWTTTTPPVVPIIGRYHDAQAKCATISSAGNGTVQASSIPNAQYVDYYYTAANSLNTQMCYGFFQFLYTSDAGTTNISHYPLDYIVDYASPTPGPDGTALPYSIWDNSTAMGAKLLNDSQTQLTAYYKSLNMSMPNMGMPTQAIVALWDPSVDWSGGAWHSNKTMRTFEPEWTEEIIKPFSNLNLYIADEAFGTHPGWAEGSLVMAENIVRDYFGATTPSWMTAKTASAVTFGPTFTDKESTAQGGGTGMPLAPSSTSNGIMGASTASGLAPAPANY